MLERIAAALETDPPELFSMRNIPAVSLKNLQKTVLEEMEKALIRIIKEPLTEAENSGEAEKTLNKRSVMLPIMQN